MSGYTDIYKTLSGAFSLDSDSGKFDGVGVAFRTFKFNSEFTRHLPSTADLPGLEKDYLGLTADQDIVENREFRYPVFMPAGYRQTNRAIILLHGLNEKSWDKYLPWARELVLRTGHAVVCFPISFHMNRTPANWLNYRSMAGLSHVRENKYTDQDCSTFANAAISERLDNMPERFALSGYQSLMDLMNLVNHISSGEHPVFKEGTEIHFFGYSIGAFLSQVLMIANPGGIVDRSRFVLFAGGTVFSHINGISRFIIDKHAFEQWRKYYLNETSWRSRTLRTYVKAMNVKNVARAFMAMLSPDYFSALRNEVFRKHSGRILVYALKEDLVFPEEHIMQNFSGTGVYVNRLHFPYEYTHETPFPVSTNDALSEKVDACFEDLFREIGDFLRDENNYGF